MSTFANFYIVQAVLIIQGQGIHSLELKIINEKLFYPNLWSVFGWKVKIAEEMQLAWAAPLFTSPVFPCFFCLRFIVIKILFCGTSTWFDRYKYQETIIIGGTPRNQLLRATFEPIFFHQKITN